MGHGAGGYRFLDFTRLGLPLTVVVGAVGTLAAPLAFPFAP